VTTLLGPALLAVAAQTPDPTPSEMTIYTVSPGIAGFVVFFVLALAGWLLFRSLTKHVRRIDHDELRRERTAQEAGAQDAAAAPGDRPGDR